MRTSKFVLLSLFTILLASSIMAAIGGNKPASASGTGINHGNLQPRWIIFTAPVSGVVTGIGGWVRNDGTGSDDIGQFLLADTFAGAPTRPYNIIDSTDRFTVTGNGSHGNFTSSQYSSNMGASVTSGKRYFIGMMAISAIGFFYAARDNSGTGYVTDTLWTGPTVTLPLTTPLASSGVGAFTGSGAQCYWVEIQEGVGGGSGRNRRLYLD